MRTWTRPTGFSSPALAYLVYFCSFVLHFSLGSHAQPPRMVIPIGHTHQINSIRYSPNGKTVLTTANDQTAKIWDARSGLLLLSYSQKGKVQPSFSKNGVFFHIHSEDTVARIIETASGKNRFTIRRPEGIEDIVFSPDGELIAIAYSNKVDILRISERKRLVSLNGSTYRLHQVRFSPGGEQILTTSEHEARIWNAGNGQLLKTFVADTLGLIKSGGITADGTRTWTLHDADWSGATNTYIAVWDNHSGEKLFVYELPDRRIKHIEYSGTSNVLGVVSSPHNMTSNHPDDVLLLQLTRKERKRLADISFPMRNVSAIEFSVSGEEIATASNALTLSLSADTGTWGTGLAFWNIRSGKRIKAFTGETYEYVSDMSFSPDGSKIAIEDVSAASIIAAGTGRTLSEFRGYSRAMREMSFFEGGRRLLGTLQGSIAIWDRYTMSPSPIAGFEDRNILGYSISGDKKICALRGVNDTGSCIQVIDLETGRILRRFDADVLSDILLSPDGRMLALHKYDSKEVEILDIKEGDITRFQSSSEPIKELIFSPDSKWLAASTSGKKVNLWNASTGLLHARFDHPESIISLAFSNDAKSIAISSFSRLVCWNVESLKQVFTNGELKYHSKGLIFSPGGEKIFVPNLYGSVEIYDLKSGKGQRGLEHSGLINTLRFSPDHTRILSSSNDGTAAVWDMQNLQKVVELKGHDNLVEAAYWSPQGSEILTLSLDNTARLWEAGTGREIFVFAAIDQNDYLVKIPSGFYLASRQASRKIHYVKPDLSQLTFEQLDILYNRPDKVIETLGSHDTALIRAYRKAWEKRIRRLGIDSSYLNGALEVPACEIVGADTIEQQSTKESMKIRIRAADDHATLLGFNVWVNESPLFGKRGISLQQAATKSLDTTITILLSQGNNRIEAAVINQYGSESFRSPLNIRFDPVDSREESVFFAGIGIDRFRNSQYDLLYSRKDIVDLAARLKAKYKNRITIDTLFNENVSVGNIRALKERLRKASINDKVIVAFSGHGLLNEDFDYYLSTYDVNFEKPGERGLPYDDLENLLDSIPARKKLLLIDACHSGEVDKDDLVRLEGVNRNGVKGLKPVAHKKEGQLGLQNSFELMQSLFVNVSKGSGATVISAAAGTQFALERGDLKNGVFTYSILEVLNKYPGIKISELRKLVGERVEQLTNGAQKPTSRSEPVASDWEL